MKLSQLAQSLGLELRGEDKEVTSVNTLEKAGESDLSFLANPKYAPLMESTRAGCVLLGEDDAHLAKTALVSANVYMDLARILHAFSKPQGEMSGASPQAFIDPGAKVHESATVYPGAFIGPRARIGEGCRIFPGCYVGEDTVLGENVTLYPNVTVMSRVEIGNNVAIHGGSVIGADGFGYAQTSAGHQKIPQIGTVRIEDDVEIGANTTIDRAALDTTVIGAGSKIDNLVMVAHNVEVGKQCIFVSQVGVAGSTKIGDGVMLAGQVGIADNLTIGSGTKLAASSGVNRSLPENFIGGGTPPMEQSTFLRSAATITKLPEMVKRLNKLEKALAKLQQAGGEE